MTIPKSSSSTQADKSSGSGSLSINDLEVLVATGKELAAEIDLPHLLDEILRRACELTGSADGSVILYDDERHGLYFAAAIGDKAGSLLEEWGEAANQRVPVQGSKAGLVFETGHAIVEDSVEGDPEHYKGVDQQTSHRTRSMVCVPLIIKGATLGVMQILNKQSGNYTSRDRIVLEQFSAQAAVAIRNARLFRDLLAQMGLYSAHETTLPALDLMKQLKQPARAERVTLMFADMRAFTTLCQILGSPDDIQGILNEFLTMLSTQVVQYGGVVNKFLGDGLFAFFRGDDGARRAVTCACTMVERFASLRTKWDKHANQVLEFLDIGVGIVTDRVIIGTIGDARVRDFTAIGTGVNLAAAFEHAARGGRRILVDQSTFLATEDLADFEGPLPYVLRKDDQEIGHPYKQYCLTRLKSAAPRQNLVFISHAHEDRQFVERRLVAPLGARKIGTWYSAVDIRAGQDFVKSIADGLMKCDWVAVVVSEHSAKSEWMKIEVSTAFSDPRLRARIIPIVLDATSPSLVSPLLRPLQALDGREAGDVAAQLAERLVSVEALAAGESSSPSPSRPTPKGGSNPVRTRRRR